jgi:hypothetical protein
VEKSFGITVSLPPQKALEMLSDSLASESVFTPLHLGTFSGARRFIGVVEGNRFRIHVRRHYANLFAPVCTGSVLPGAEGSRIEATITALPAGGVGLALWTALVVLVLVAVVAWAALSGESLGAATGLLIMLGAMLLVGVGLASLGKLLSRGVDEQLRQFLKDLYIEFATEPGDFVEPA